ncbi:Ufm1-conjugating enzyme 1 [Thecamonas trahens ATCC 50062]|uniref:Ubiquitin-fold modifier-conjugating enzyme 1 n=1 Tax=Thecamonas trahens ATCC 50062 TaxID=461836 RepID=A0A0L0D5W2_THETB|nr:Ufm1-conjugating enzyme 1 [Thecamonas trahens ATCC 50062]KNC47744.1 Ufm1-conjugating enzyme 1 [Thecamonas trahens ATCC 50062]|eukprot:XP_013759222.1 Ufm1-conjugating enzyme 1 [Thecamonas trahens ATCC 50062]
MAAVDVTDTGAARVGDDDLNNLDEARAVKAQIPSLGVMAGPRDGEEWIARLKEEYAALIAYAGNNKANATDWFKIEANKSGTRWFGTCWYVHNLIRYEFELVVTVPVTFPKTSVAILLPELENKTPKMYRGGAICLTEHFHPLWARNVPHFGIAHALALGLAPWLAAEVPHLVAQGSIEPAAAASSGDGAAGSAVGNGAAYEYEYESDE